MKHIVITSYHLTVINISGRFDWFFFSFCLFVVVVVVLFGWFLLLLLLRVLFVCF